MLSSYYAGNKLIGNTSVTYVDLKCIHSFVISICLPRYSLFLDLLNNISFGLSYMNQFYMS